jgi:hypothetical protein
MKRREFLSASTALAGSMLPVWARAQTSPCPPPSLGVSGGASVTTPCTAEVEVSSGAVTLVGSNSMYDLVDLYPARLGGWPTYALGYAAGGAYGSGTYVPGYGSKGSYVVCMSSGDTAPQLSDAVIFDFSTLTWSLQVNADGVPNSLSTTYCDAVSGKTATTDGAPYYEMKGKPGVPHPGQLYRLPVGVGTRFIRTLGSFMGGDIRTAPYAHQYDLATARYSRLTNSAATPVLYTSNWAVEPIALYDARLNRIWLVLEETAYGTYLPYLDLTDNTWKKSASFAAPPTTGSSLNWQHALLHDDGTNRCILTFKNPSFKGSTSPNYARVIDLNNIGAGWRNVELVGPLHQFAASTYGGLSNQIAVRWAQYPADNCHYTYDGRSDAFSRIKPPSSGILGTWTVSQVKPSAGAIPKQMQGGGAGETSDLCHYTRFFYVPPLGSFAWVAGGKQKVALWKP